MMRAPHSLSLLCLPCAGASATMYLRWRRSLPEWVRVVPVELPGRGTRMGEDWVTAYEPMIALLCEEQSSILRAGLYVLLGHSMGALLAHGMAQRVRANGWRLPEALLVSACAAPSRRDAAYFSNRNDDAVLMADLRRQGGTPEEVLGNAELMRITLDTLRADYRICSDFAHAAAAHSPLPMPLHAFAGRADEITPQDMQAWAAHTHGEFTLDWFDGGHFFIRHQEASFIAALTQRLRQVQLNRDVGPHAMA